MVAFKCSGQTRKRLLCFGRGYMVSCDGPVGRSDGTISCMTRRLSRSENGIHAVLKDFSTRRHGREGGHPRGIASGWRAEIPAFRGDDVVIILRSRMGMDALISRVPQNVDVAKASSSQIDPIVSREDYRRGHCVRWDSLERDAALSPLPLTGRGRGWGERLASSLAIAIKSDGCLASSSAHEQFMSDRVDA
jgi:hypothetical protein